MKALKEYFAKLRKKRNYGLYKKFLKKEWDDLHYFSEEEKRILKKPPISRTKRERFAYNELYSVVKASAFAEALFKIKN